MANKQPFKTAYSGWERKYTEPGRRMQDNYEYAIDDYGRKVLIKSGETDLYAKIQESHEESKIETILARVAVGDTSVFRPDGIYEDISEVPNNFIEVRQQIQKMENTWKKLPKEIKEHYNNNMEDFIAAAGSKEWLIDMGLLKEEAAPINETPVQEEVTENE